MTQESRAATHESEDAKSDRLRGIIGWLYLVALTVVLAPLRVVLGMFAIYVVILSNDDRWRVLTSPESQIYHPLFEPLYLARFGLNGLLFLAYLVSAYFFFAKKRIFPRCYIGLILFNLVLFVGDTVVLKIIFFPQNPLFDKATVLDFGRVVSACVIWIPYMLISKRVKATFVE